MTMIFNFLSKYPHCSHQFYSCYVYSHFPSRATWSNCKIITVTGNSILDNVLVAVVVVLAQGPSYRLHHHLHHQYHNHRHQSLSLPIPAMSVYMDILKVAF